VDLGHGGQVADRVLVLSHELHRNPEIAWEEHESAARVAAELGDAGFTVETDYVDCPRRFAPAWEAGRCT
jgi:metal-dependent amidase/aminoacylase/carboxypeptidase family protein